MLRSAFNYLILERNARLSEDRMRILQWQKFQRLIDHAYNHVPYYRELFDGAGICPKDIANREDVCKIPVTTKTDLRNAGEKVFSSAYARNRLHRFQTSGSTGEPFLSYFDNRSHNILKFASKIRARRRCGLRFVLYLRRSVTQVPAEGGPGEPQYHKATDNPALPFFSVLRGGKSDGLRDAGIGIGIRRVHLAASVCVKVDARE